MLPKVKYCLFQNRPYQILNPVILHRIAGFFYSTEICVSRLFLPENYSKWHERAIKYNIFRKIKKDKKRDMICSPLVE